MPSASLRLLYLNQEHTSENYVFWSNPYKIKVMITSLIIILELPNFGHMRPHLQYDLSHTINFFGHGQKLCRNLYIKMPLF